MSTPLITAGRDLPAFSEDLSTWRIEIDDTGLLVQEIRESTHANGYSSERRRAMGRVSSSDLEEILEIAERVGFERLDEHISSSTLHATDQETVSISIRYGESVKRVEVYGPIIIAMFDPDYRHLKGFVELWERIHRQAPYPSKVHRTLEALEHAAGAQARWKEEERTRTEAFEAAAAERGIMNVSTVKNGFALCPHCALQFALYSDHSWDGSRHTTCGTQLRLPECLRGLRTKVDFRGIHLRG